MSAPQSMRRSLRSALIALTAAFGRRTPLRSAPVVEIRHASVSSGLLATFLGARSSAFSREGELEQAASSRAAMAKVGSYLIVFRIMTVLVSDTPSILRMSSMHLLISTIAGAAIIAAMSYWPVIS